MAKVHNYLPERGFGFVRTTNGEEAFFHISWFHDDGIVPVVGLEVTCRLVHSQKGLNAQELLISDGRPLNGRADWLAQAILARDERRYDEAARLYEKGLTHEPSVQLVLSYAAMEKNRNRKPAAIRIYDEGIKRFPENAKLREDAGILAASLRDFVSAIAFLHDSLALCRRTQQGGEKGVLLGLARTNYQIGALSALRAAIKHYESARDLFGRGRTLTESSQRNLGFRVLGATVRINEIQTVLGVV